MKKILLAFILFSSSLSLPMERVYSAQPTAEATAQLIKHKEIGGQYTRSARLKAFLAQFETHFQSPLAGEADHIVIEADANRIDWKLIVAIAGVESTFCQHIPQSSYNCWGWGIPTGASHGLTFGSYKEAISTISKGLRENYLERGHNSLEKIGRVYATSPVWAYKVRFFMAQIEHYQDNSTRGLDITL